VTILSFASINRFSNYSINEVTGNKAGVCYVPRRKWDKKDWLLAFIKKARALIGYELTAPFKIGLKNAIEWFRDHWDQIDASACFGPGVSSAVREMTGMEKGK
jgi:UDP-glucose 4-epimerase